MYYEKGSVLVKIGDNSLFNHSNDVLDIVVVVCVMKIYTTEAECITFLAVVFLTPLHYTAYLGQPDVRFHCSAANASDISWRINGRSIGSNIADLNVRGISTETDYNILESTLTISSTASNSNTHILCVAIHLVEFRYVRTDEAVFKVQGQLTNIPTIQHTFCHCRHLLHPCSV